MQTRRKVLALLAAILVGGSLAWTTGYGLRLRSDSHRKRVEDRLTQFFQLPCAVGRIRGHTFASRMFNDVEVWLPDRRDRVFSCERAIWWEGRNGGEASNGLELINGSLVLGTDRWARDDYRQVFQSGLAHNFEELDLSTVEMSNFRIIFDRGGISIHCGETSGTIDMSKPGDGVAHLVAYELGGSRVSQGVRIEARFLPRNGVEISEFVLALPEVPIACIGLAPVIGPVNAHGRFAGRVRYNRNGEEATLRLDGTIEDADLADWGSLLPGVPIAGRFSMAVHEARITQETITHFRGRGRIADLTLDSLAPLLGRATIAGTATLNVDSIDLALGHINRLRVEGAITDLLLEQWLELWGRGGATGRLAVRINNLDFADERIRSADIEISAIPPPGQPGKIDRDVLLAAAEGAFDFTWPESLPRTLLPDDVEYTRLGMRLLVQDNKMRVLGTHGVNGDAILTISIFGAPIPIVKEQKHTIDLGPYLEVLLNRLRSYDPSRARDWWRAGPAASRELEPAR